MGGSEGNWDKIIKKKPEKKKAQKARLLYNPRSRPYSDKYVKNPKTPHKPSADIHG